jgi:hypothetical protein
MRNLLQNIRSFEANIKTLSKFHIQANIRLQIFTYKQILACKYSHTSKYLRHIASDCFATNHVSQTLLDHQLGQTSFCPNGPAHQPQI